MKRSCSLRILTFFGILAALLFTCPVPAGTIVTTAEAQQVSASSTKKKGLVYENKKFYYYVNGKKIKNVWKTLYVRHGGKMQYKKYYFQSDGSAAVGLKKISGYHCIFTQAGRLVTCSTPKLVTCNGRQYAPSTTGVCRKGWLIIDGKLYYACSSGHIIKNKTVAGISLGKDGAAAADDLPGLLRMECMRVVTACTNSSMSKEQKLRACWNYLTNDGDFYYSLLPVYPYTDSKWTMRAAYTLLSGHRGACEHFACAFAALAKQIGYYPVVIYGRVPGNRDGAADGFTTHCWVTINGLYYDPEACFAGWLYCYGESYYPIDYQVRFTTQFKNK